MRKLGFRARLLAFYTPVIIGGLGTLSFNLFGSPSPATAHATPTVTKIVYSGTYASGSPSVSKVKPNVFPQLSCKPDTGFQAAGPVSIAGQPGLSVQTDAPYSHEMFGYNGQQLDQLSRQCPLVISGDSEPYINAYTSYWIGWQYDYQPLADGSCQIQNPRVQVHIRQALPAWVNLSSANPTLAAQWKAYQSAVVNHEAGHVSLINSYSSQFLTALQGLGPQDCSIIENSVKTLGQNYVAQLGQANVAYDNATQHGAAQGAIVP